MVFDTLMGGKVDEVSFAPYGLETTERVGQDMDQLLHGRWLPATETTTVFSYRANAYVGSGLRQRSYKLEITDYAGEYTTEFVPGGASWLHRSDYFRYVTRSDAVFLIVDAGLIMADADRTRSLESSYVAAVEALVEAKGQSGARMINTPVGLVFTKLDLVLSDEKDSKTAVDELASRLPRLVGRCRSLCRHFATFAVSAVGSLSPDGGPPAELRPLGVVEPLRWVLTRTTRP